MTLYPGTKYDIPILLGTGTPAVAEPVYPWGGIGRERSMRGTWVFYVDDYRFTAMLRDPARVLRAGPTAAVEPNITLYEQSPEAEAIWATWRKRHVARQWQDAGLQVRVDLNVPERWREVSMLGVPDGWTAFATRGYAARERVLADECEFARRWGGPSAVTLVYGGGARVAALCRDLPGAVYVPPHLDPSRRAIK